MSVTLAACMRVKTSGMRTSPTAPTIVKNDPARIRAQLRISSTRSITTRFLLGVVGEIAVAEELEHRQRADQIEQAVGHADVEQFGAAGQEADDGQQQDRQRADRVAGQHAVENRRPLERAEHGERQGDEDGEAAAANITPSPRTGYARVHSAGFEIELRPRAPAHAR